MTAGSHKYIDANAVLEYMKERRFHVGRASDPVCIIEDAAAADVVPRELFIEVLKQLECAERALIREYSCDIEAAEKDLEDRMSAYWRAAGIG